MSEPGAGSIDHRAQVETLLASILRLMDYPARLDFSDLSDGALGVAMHFEGELPGITPGKRSYLVDCLQFLLNKAINRPNVPRRWVNLGVNAFPEVRTAKHAEKPRPSVPAGESRPAKPAPPPPSREQKPKVPDRAHHEVPEEGLDVAPDPHWTRLGHGLLEKARHRGRVYAVMMLSKEQRARLLKSAAGATGASARVEGDGHWRRLTIVPDKLAPLPKKHVMPDWDDDESDD
jgi:hypothetical protein